MGLFDSTMVPCHNCGKLVEFQSKAGDCEMYRYTLEDAPTEILRDIVNCPEYCRACDRWLALLSPELPPGPPPRPQVRTAIVKTPEGVTIHPSQSFLRWWPAGHEFSYDDLDE
jgi:hypothetical protein